MTIKQCNKTTTLIAQAGRKLDERIHAVAVSGLAHFLQHGDNTVLTNLVKAMPKSARGNALKFFISKHTKGSLQWKASAHNKTGGYVGKKLEISSWEKIAIVLDAEAEPFYKKEDTEKAEWNPQASVLSLVAKLNKYKQDHSLTLTEESKQALIRAIG